MLRAGSRSSAAANLFCTAANARLCGPTAADVFGGPTTDDGGTDPTNDQHTRIRSGKTADSRAEILFRTKAATSADRQRPAGTDDVGSNDGRADDDAANGPTNDGGTSGSPVMSVNRLG